MNIRGMLCTEIVCLLTGIVCSVVMISIILGIGYIDSHTTFILPHMVRGLLYITVFTIPTIASIVSMLLSIPRRAVAYVDENLNVTYGYPRLVCSITSMCMECGRIGKCSIYNDSIYKNNIGGMNVAVLSCRKFNYGRSESLDE